MATAVVASGLTVIGGQTAFAEVPADPAPMLQRDENVVTADPIPTVQIDNGYVWAQTTVGSTVYAVGKFDNAREPLADPGTALTARANVLAYDIDTGHLLSFAPRVNGLIKAVAASPDGRRIYIGGSFNSVNGQARWNIAALDAQTGELVPGFAPSIGGSGVYALTTSGSTVYAGGLFSQANGVARKNLAAFDSERGALSPWAPKTDRQVDAMVMNPVRDSVVVAGRFFTVNGSKSYGSVAVDKATGVIDSTWTLPTKVTNAGVNGGVFALATDETGVYGTGWMFAHGNNNLEGAFAVEAATGDLRWVANCLGDHYGVYSTGSVVYTTSHMHGCSSVNSEIGGAYRYASAYTADARGTLKAGGQGNFKGAAAPSQYMWSPDWTVGKTTGLGQAGLSITGAGNMISIGGEFTTVNNRRFEGIVRFSTTPPGGAKEKPRLSGSTWTAPTLTSPFRGWVTAKIRANWDRDDYVLNYDLMRAGEADPVATTRAERTWSSSSTVELIDKTAEPGKKYEYTVVARDGDGNAVGSRPASITVSNTAVPPYVAAVSSLNPSIYYSGNVTSDWGGRDLNPAAPSAGVTATTGLSSATTRNKAWSFKGRSTSVSSKYPEPGSAQFSGELWFKTATKTGGSLLGQGPAPTGESSAQSRQVFLADDGRVVFGVVDGMAKVIQSAAGLNDNKWHQVVATQDSAGMKLFVDGILVASDATVTRASDAPGLIRIGGGDLSGWPSASSSNFFQGAVDEVAVYPTALTPSQIQEHYVLGQGFVPPTVSFTSTLKERTATFDARGTRIGSGATAADAGYRWEFGDGTEATGKTASHDFAGPGTYPVRLTVMDSRGLSSTSEKVVQIDAAVDTFTRTVKDGWGDADSGGSWQIVNGASATASVASGWGSSQLQASGVGEMALRGSTLVDTTQTLTYRVATAPTTGSSYVGLGARRTGAQQGYRALAWHRADGTVWLVLQRNGVTVSSTPVSGLTWSANRAFELSMTVNGDTVSTKIWAKGTAEPSAAQLSFTDDAALAGGESTIYHYRAGRATADGKAQFDALKVQNLGIVKANEAPTAAFVVESSGLTATIDGSGSADVDGTISAYAWDFGDGITGEGAATAHAYAAAGTYTVRLTVTDDAGATSVATRDVTVTEPAPDLNTDPDPGAGTDPASTLPRDDFERETGQGWGEATVGGAWTISGGPQSAASVADGVGRLSLAASETRLATIGSDPIVDAVIEMQFRVDQAPETGGGYIGVIARSTGEGQYRVQAWLRPDGTVWLVVNRGGTLVSAKPIPGLVYGADETFMMKVSVTGSSQATLAAKVWAADSVEPAEWQLTVTDDAALAPGAVGVSASRSKSATTPATIRIDSFRTEINRP